MKRVTIVAILLLVLSATAFGTPWREVIYDPEVDRSAPRQIATSLTPPTVEAPGELWTEASVSEKRTIAKFVVASLKAGKPGILSRDIWEIPIEYELNRLYNIPENWHVPLDGMIYYIITDVIPNREEPLPYGAPTSLR